MLPGCWEYGKGIDCKQEWGNILEWWKCCISFFIGGSITIYLSKWWILLYVNLISVKRKEKTLRFRVVMGIIRDHSPSPCFIMFGSLLSSAASMSFINLGPMINCNFLFQGWDTTENLCLYLSLFAISEADFKSTRQLYIYTSRYSN